MFLDFSISIFKSSKIAKNSRFRCLQTHIPVSANSYTGVVELVYRCRELVYRCLWTRIPVSSNSYTGVVKSYTGTRVYHFRTPVYEFDDTGIRVHRHRTRGIEFRRSVEISDNLPKLGLHCKNYSATMLFSADLQWAGTLYLNWDLKGQSHENQG